MSARTRVMRLTVRPTQKGSTCWRRSSGSWGLTGGATRMRSACWTRGGNRGHPTVAHTAAAVHEAVQWLCDADGGGRRQHRRRDRDAARGLGRYRHRAGLRGLCAESETAGSVSRPVHGGGAKDDRGMRMCSAMPCAPTDGRFGGPADDPAHHSVAGSRAIAGRTAVEEERGWPIVCASSSIGSTPRGWRSVRRPMSRGCGRPRRRAGSRRPGRSWPAAALRQRSAPIGFGASPPTTCARRCSLRG